MLCEGDVHWECPSYHTELVYTMQYGVTQFLSM